MPGIGQAILVVGLLLAASVTVVLLLRYVARRGQRRLPPPNLTVDLAALAGQGPQGGFPRLTVVGIPVRLVAVVLAPAGRGGVSELAAMELLDWIVPGLSEVAQRDGAEIRHWAAQLSTQGFVAAFAANVRLPAETRLEKSPWCLLAGRLAADDGAALVGLVLEAQKPNSLGRIDLGNPPRWLELLRVTQQSDPV